MILGKLVLLVSFAERNEPAGHFVYGKFPSSPGSHPTENRTCREDLWAAFVLWGVFYFLWFVFFFSMWWKDQQNPHSKWRFSFSSKCLMFENDALCSSKIMLTNSGKWRNYLSVTKCRSKHLKKRVNPALKNLWQGIFPSTVFSFHFL